ncbi:MAG TPA: hypothetical protein VK849_10315 [Longimicrobiales bacterium]|nr:hypothetical protein [Longimicrobiales bacterium]
MAHFIEHARRAWPACVLCTALAVASAPAGLRAQGAGGFQVGVRAGSLQHSRLGWVNGTLSGIGADGLSVDADVDAESSLHVGASLARPLSESLLLRLRVARTTTHMRLDALTTPLGGAGTQQTRQYTFDGLGDVTVWLVDVDLAWSPWSEDAPVRPYVFGGLGASHWDISGLEGLGAFPPLLESPVDVRPVSALLPGVVLGAGFAVPVASRVTLEMELSDHISGDPLADEDFRVGATFSGSGRAKNLVHNLSLTAGTRIAVAR